MSEVHTPSSNMLKKHIRMILVIFQSHLKSVSQRKLERIPGLRRKDIERSL